MSNFFYKIFNIYERNTSKSFLKPEVILYALSMKSYHCIIAIFLTFVPFFILFFLVGQHCRGHIMATFQLFTGGGRPQVPCHALFQA
jgi:hypothetical protein